MQTHLTLVAADSQRSVNQPLALAHVSVLQHRYKTDWSDCVYGTNQASFCLFSFFSYNGRRYGYFMLVCTQQIHFYEFNKNKVSNLIFSDGLKNLTLVGQISGVDLKHGGALRRCVM